MSSFYSAESVRGWEQSYLRLPLWMDRIREVRGSGNRMRDELDFYMFFFIQCFSLKDWLEAQGILDRSILNSAIERHEEMQICRDICNRYKHLLLTKGKPSIDASWQLSRSLLPFSDNDDWEWIIHFGRGKRYTLWELMGKCIEFWKTLLAQNNLEPKGTLFDREFPL